MKTSLRKPLDGRLDCRVNRPRCKFIRSLCSCHDRTLDSSPSLDFLERLEQAIDSLGGEHCRVDRLITDAIAEKIRLLAILGRAMVIVSSNEVIAGVKPRAYCVASAPTNRLRSFTDVAFSDRIAIKSFRPHR